MPTLATSTGSISELRTRTLKRGRGIPERFHRRENSFSSQEFGRAPTLKKLVSGFRTRRPKVGKEEFNVFRTDKDPLSQQECDRLGISITNIDGSPQESGTRELKGRFGLKEIKEGLQDPYVVTNNPIIDKIIEGPESVTDILVGEMIADRYYVIDEIDKGLMNGVYFVQDTKTGKFVVLKIPLDTGNFDADRCLEREITALSLLQHNNII